jgi:hypothetical protein
MVNKRVLVKYENLSQDLKEVINEKFPFGVEEFLMKVPKGKNDFFYAFTFDHDDIRYMVKVSEGTVMLDDMLEEEDDALTGVEDGAIGDIEGMDGGGDDDDDDKPSKEEDDDDDDEDDADDDASSEEEYDED